MSRWKELGAKSDRAEIREEITRLIRLGEVWVRPRRGDPDRVEVIPCDPPPSPDLNGDPLNRVAVLIGVRQSLE